MKKVIIVGAGFAGMNAAKLLSRRADVEVLLLDRRNHHLFQPLLYQVAMAGLSPADISVPIRSLFRHRENVRVLLAEVTDLDRAAKQVITNVGTFDYDYLIMACGAEHSYFGRPEWEDFAPGLKTLEQATEIRRRVLTAFERAESAPSPVDASPWLTFVVVGGGPTGVELAGTLGEITHYTLRDDFRAIDPSRARVVLVEAGPTILPSFPEKLRQRAMRDLKDLGVEVCLNGRVTDVRGTGVRIGEKFLEARTVIWARRRETLAAQRKAALGIGSSGPGHHHARSDVAGRRPRLHPRRSGALRRSAGARAFAGLSTGRDATGPSRRAADRLRPRR